MKHYRQEHYGQHHRQELTLDNVFTDPLVSTMMKADGVDPHELNALLRDIVASLDQAQLRPRNPSSIVATNCG